MVQFNPISRIPVTFAVIGYSRNRSGDCALVIAQSSGSSANDELGTPVRELWKMTDDYTKTSVLK